MNIRHEKILKRDDGTRVKILVETYEPRHGVVEYRSNVFTCEKRKRTWNKVCDTDSFSYRCLSMDERRKAEYDAQFPTINKTELLDAKLELWNKLKPTCDVK